jgi:uncharacterized protein
MSEPSEPRPAKIVNFHLPADDVERAAAFYQNVFGWRFTAYPDVAVPYLVADGEAGAGIPAAITQRQPDVIKAPVPTIDVKNIDQALIDVVLNGGQQARVQEIAGIGRFAYAIDSEGNVIALLQRAG